MDLIFRGMSRAAGVEIPPGSCLPWEKSVQETSASSFKGLYPVVTSKKAAQYVISTFLALVGKLLGSLGNHLIRASNLLGAR